MVSFQRRSGKDWSGAHRPKAPALASLGSEARLVILTVLMFAFECSHVSWSAKIVKEKSPLHSGYTASIVNNR